MMTPTNNKVAKNTLSSRAKAHHMLRLQEYNRYDSKVPTCNLYPIGYELVLLDMLVIQGDLHY